jgi:wobble nucleotide-excising tRNase
MDTVKVLENGNVLVELSCAELEELGANLVDYSCTDKDMKQSLLKGIGTAISCCRPISDDEWYYNIRKEDCDV